MLLLDILNSLMLLDLIVVANELPLVKQCGFIDLALTI